MSLYIRIIFQTCNRIQLQIHSTLIFVLFRRLTASFKTYLQALYAAEFLLSFIGWLVGKSNKTYCMFDSRLYSWRLCKFPIDRLFNVKSDNEIIHDARDCCRRRIFSLDYFPIRNELRQPRWKTRFLEKPGTILCGNSYLGPPLFI